MFIDINQCDSGNPFSWGKEKISLAVSWVGAHPRIVVAGSAAIACVAMTYLAYPYVMEYFQEPLTHGQLRKQFDEEIKKTCYDWVRGTIEDTHESNSKDPFHTELLDLNKLSPNDFSASVDGSGISCSIKGTFDNWKNKVELGCGDKMWHFINIDVKNLSSSLINALTKMGSPFQPNDGAVYFRVAEYCEQMT